MTRRWLYHADCPQGQIFEGDEQVAAALKEGWVDSPARIGEAPSPPEAEPEVEAKTETAEATAKPKRGSKAS